MDNFCEVYMYTNQTALKRYLINNEITAENDDYQVNLTLSDNQAGGILYFNKAVSPEIVKNYCCNGNYDVAVVLKVLISKECLAVAYDKNGNVLKGKVSEFQNAIAFFVEDSVSFSNVVSITPIEKQLVFLQGDTTLGIPTRLIGKKDYSPKTVIPAELVNMIVSSLKTDESSENESSAFMEDMDEFDLNSVVLSANDDTNSKKDFVNIKNKLLAGYLMLLQGNRPLNGKLDANLFSLLSGDYAFEDFIKSKVYPDIPFDISTYLKKPNSLLFNYFLQLRNVAQGQEKHDSFYSIVITTLLDYDIKDKDEFRTMVLERISDLDFRNHVEQCLSDQRARDRIALLRNSKDPVLPVYALYIFYDYGFDRLNENIIEFGLNGTVCVPILLSLWAIKNGMKSIYEEYKNPEVLYAGESQIACWQDNSHTLISIDAFHKINGIKLSPEELLVGNYRCTYVNASVEYYYCVGKTDEKIQKLIEKLKDLLDKTLPFQYGAMKEAIKKTNTTPTDINLYAPQIHKQYLSLTKKKTTRKKTAKNEEASLSPQEELNLFSMIQKGDTQ